MRYRRYSIHSIDSMAQGYNIKVHAIQHSAMKVSAVQYSAVHSLSIKAIGLELFVLTTILFFVLTRRHKLRLNKKTTAKIVDTARAKIQYPWPTYRPYTG